MSEGDRYRVRDRAKPRPGQQGKLQGQQVSRESDQRETVKEKKKMR